MCHPLLPCFKSAAASLMIFAAGRLQGGVTVAPTGNAKALGALAWLRHSYQDGSLLARAQALLASVTTMA